MTDRTLHPEGWPTFLPCPCEACLWIRAHPEPVDRAEFNLPLADNDEAGERLARWEDEDYPAGTPATPPPLPTEAERLVYEADRPGWREAENDRHYGPATDEPGDHDLPAPNGIDLDEAQVTDLCWWCEKFTAQPRVPLLWADGASPIIHAHCVDEYVSTTDAPRLTKAEANAVATWCQLYDDGCLIDSYDNYSDEDIAALALLRSQLQ